MRQSLALCRALNILGVDYNNIFLCGKSYSTNIKSHDFLRLLGVQVAKLREYDTFATQSSDLVIDLLSLSRGVVPELQKRSHRSIIVLDDGGLALTTIHSWAPPSTKIVGVEQTASGFRQTGISSVGFPVVDVGASAAKRYCESPLIAEAIIERANSFRRIDKKTRVGIIGFGFIGEAIAKKVLDIGSEVIIYDIRNDIGRNIEKIRRSDSLYDVFYESDVIFGCSGSDSSGAVADEISKRGISNKLRFLISASSGDEEFFSIKQKADRGIYRSYDVSTIPDISVMLGGSEFVLCRNGFPINFDNSEVSVPINEIQGTVAALIGALAQAVTLQGIRGAAGRVTLEPRFQKWLMRRWNAVIGNQQTRTDLWSLDEIANLSFGRFEPLGVRIDTPLGDWFDSD